MVSTHSRPKAAGGTHQWRWLLHYVSTHSRPKAAGRRCCGRSVAGLVSTHSRPKAAGRMMLYQSYSKEFQHTAARRRLGKLNWNC